MPPIELHEKLYRLRRYLEFSQLYIASCLDITPEAYSKIERGKTTISVPRLRQIAMVFGLEDWGILQFSTDALLLLLKERQEIKKC
jgi:transcriptional regulator with XRE-family HTH domain